MQETGVFKSSITISRYHDPVKYLDLCIVIDITTLTIYAGVYAVPYDIPVGFIHQTITVHIKGRACGDIPHNAHAAVPVHTHVCHVMLPLGIPCMRPCLGVVILVGAVEVPGAGDWLVCGHAEWGGESIEKEGDRKLIKCFAHSGQHTIILL